MAFNVTKLINESLSQNITNDEYEQNYNMIVGKNVKHKFADGQWYLGKVISRVPGYKTWYNIVYQREDTEETESVYTYELMKDFKNWDLQILTISEA